MTRLFNRWYKRPTLSGFPAFFGTLYHLSERVLQTNASGFAKCSCIYVWGSTRGSRFGRDLAASQGSDKIQPQFFIFYRSYRCVFFFFLCILLVHTWVVFYLRLNVLSEASSCILLVVRASKNEECEASQSHHLTRWIDSEGGWKVTWHQDLSRRSLDNTWIYCPNKPIFIIYGHFYKLFSTSIAILMFY